MYPSFFSNCYLFFMTIIIIATVIHIPMCLCVDNDQYVTCGTPIQCGNIQNAGYPFWGQRRPGYCGYPGFQLSCQVDNVPIITIQSMDFRVLAIDNTTHTLTVARQDLWNNTCPNHLYNTTLDSALFSYGSNQQDVTLYYGCTATQQLLNQFNCTVNGTTSINYYSTAVGLNSAVCNSSIIIPVNQTSAQALANTSASVSDLEAALAGGFGLQWSANDTLCNQCVQSYGRCGYNTNSGSFTCYCADQPYPLTCNLSVPTQSGANHAWNLSLTLASVSLTVLGLISVIFVTIWCLRRRGLSIKAVIKNMNDQKVEALIRSYGSFTPKRYSYKDIEKMTNSFKDKLGQGGYGSVFKGKLSDGCLVAVKVLSEANGDGEDFINEVASMSRTSHVNVVTLLGFCFEGSKRALIYEFMPNRSLEKYICSDGSSNTSCRLEWKTLYKIAIGVARGLEYLHQGCNTRIVHFDIKPQNILLDEDFCPKISDFGLAKLCKRKESIVSMLVARGTPGYIAPEVFCRNFGGVSNKSDVYSYGMMVVEMVGARKNIEVGVACTSELYFPDWIYEHLEHDNDLNLYGVTTEEEEETARKMILVSLWCIQTNPSVRPSMSKVVEMLEGSLQSLQIPPKPFVFSPTRQSQDTSASLEQSWERIVEQREY